MTQKPPADRTAKFVVLNSDDTIGLATRSLAPPCGDQVLVRVAAAGCNRADLLQRAGRYPAPAGAPKDVPGLEFSGVVAEAGGDTVNLSVGDRVMGITGGGAQAEYLLIPENLCVRVPDHLDLVTAGAIPEAYFTAFEALIVQGNMRAGSRVFVNAVGSGVGTAIVQLARALGAKVSGTTRTPEKLARCRDLGLDNGLVADGNETQKDLQERLIETAGGEFDVAIDLLGGRHLPLALSVLRSGGTAVSLGFLDDNTASVNIPMLVARRLKLVGTSLRGRPNHEKAALASRFAHEVLPLLDDNLITPVIDRIVDISDVENAYDALASNTTFGKVLLSTGWDT